MSRMASASVGIIMASMIASVKAKFGLAMKDERAAKLVRHVSPDSYYRNSRSCGRKKKQNRLHLKRVAKVARRRA